MFIIRWNVSVFTSREERHYTPQCTDVAVPAAVAGVKDIVAVTPTFTDENITLAALYIAGVTEVYTAGGAQAVAALAYGTESIKKSIK